jgi:hypothetical protein
VPEAEEAIEKACEQLVQLSERFDSPVIMFHVFQVGALRYEWQHDYPAVLEVCARAEQYLSDHPEHFDDGQAYELLKVALRTHLNLGDFAHGKLLAERLLRKLPSGTEAWYKTMETYFLLSMHTAQYINALAVYREVVSLRAFRGSPSSIKKRWMAFEAYLLLVWEIESKKMPFLRQQKFPRFKWADFPDLESTGAESKDPFFFFLTVGRWLSLLEKKRFSEAAARLPHLLSSSKLKNPNNRARLFVKGLQRLVQNGFVLDIRTLKGKWLEKFSETPFCYRGHDEDMEILPYEMLWAMAAAFAKK